jgi:hypothetical protein
MPSGEAVVYNFLKFIILWRVWRRVQWENPRDYDYVNTGKVIQVFLCFEAVS